MNDQENCTLSKHCGAWACYIKASLCDKALADQIRRDLQLVPSWPSLLITSHCGKFSYVINRDAESQSPKKNHLDHCQVVEMDVEYECHG